MKCPFCNADMKDGQVFCEKCGKEIHLVPLFDPQVEETISTSMSGILEEFQESKTEYIEAPVEEASFQTNKSKLKMGILAIGCSVVAILAASILLFVVIYMNQDKNAETALQKAKNAFSAEQYEDAILYCTDVLKEEQNKTQSVKDTSADITEDNSEVVKTAYTILTKSYLNMNQEEEAIACLKDWIAYLPDQPEPYELYITIEDKRQNYQAIADLLAGCNVEKILTEYGDYCCKTPEFGTESGYYEEIVYLKLISEGNGAIYYTINGEKPDETSEQYISPIKLESGMFHIAAVYVNPYGVESPVAKAKYDISVVTPDAPDVSLQEGSYGEPQYVEVFMPDDTYSVYYTTDGSAPDLSSNKYSAPILIPFGTTHYRFIMYDEDGVGSDIADRTYQFSLETPTITMEQARIMLLQNLIVQGVIMNIDGLVLNSDEIKEYSCKTAFGQDGSVYYLFVENVVDALGNRISTNNYYGVDIMTGAIVKVRKTEDGYYYVNVG